MKSRNTYLFFFFLLTLLLTASSCSRGVKKPEAGGSAPSSSDTASVVFAEYEHDFGKVIAGEKVAYTFTYTNNGNAPLVISQATTTCGCTVSKYSRKPVPPGETGTIEVVFDSSGRNGRQTKTITVRSNSTRSLVLLKITGEVINNDNN